MSFEVRWLVEGRVIFIRSWGDVVIEEIAAINHEVLEKAESGTAPLYVISGEDWANIRNLPIDLKTLIRTFTFFSHPKIAWTLAYSAKISSLGQFLTQAVTQYHRCNYRRFTDSSATLQFLKQIEPDFQIPETDLVPKED